MARAYTLANGSLLVGVDNHGYVRDMFFPRIGLENHVSGEKHRVGVFVDGTFTWLEDPSWHVGVSCNEHTLAGSIVAINEWLGIEMHVHDVVYNERDIFVREIEVKNLRKEARTIKIFFAQVFRIWESMRGDTAFFDPRCDSIIHYKGRRVFLINAQLAGDPFDAYTTGLYQVEGKHGAYRDAEDGSLSKNPIEHSSVDSVISISGEFKGGETQHGYYWVAVGRYMHEVHDLNAYVLEKTPKHLIQTTTDYWSAWLQKEHISLTHLDDAVVEVFNKSLLTARAHADNAGAIIASSDSDMLNQGRDTYSYMWPRDAGFVALALTMVGDFPTTRRFLAFCNEVVTKEGYFMHKYLPDGSVGSSWHPWVRDGEMALPIQEEETGIVLIVLRRYYELSRDIEFVEQVYNSLIKRCADFLVDYTDPHTQLPKPSYDLWEEKYGVHTYTTSVVLAALEAAAFFSELLGKNDVAEGYRRVAADMKAALLEHLFNEEQGVFRKSALVHKDGSMLFDDTIDMSNVFGLYKFGVLEPDDPKIISAIENIEAELRLGEGTIGGVPRFQEDGYYRVSRTLPPNPWNITTLWLAQYYLMIAKEPEDLVRVHDMLKWVAKYASASGVLSEQLHPHTGEQIGATPLAWSQAEFAITVIEYLQKLDDFGVCKTCYPLSHQHDISKS